MCEDVEWNSIFFFFDRLDQCWTLLLNVYVGFRGRTLTEYVVERESDIHVETQKIFFLNVHNNNM